MLHPSIWINRLWVQANFSGATAARFKHMTMVQHYNKKGERWSKNEHKLKNF